MTSDAARLFRTRRVRLVLIAASFIGVAIGADTLLLHVRLDPLAHVLDPGHPVEAEPERSSRTV